MKKELIQKWAFLSQDRNRLSTKGMSQQVTDVVHMGCRYTEHLKSSFYSLIDKRGGFLYWTGSVG